MKLEIVQFISVVNHYGQNLQGASTGGNGNLSPGQPPFDITLVPDSPGMPSVRLEKGGRVTLVPITNVASFRLLPLPEVKPQPTAKK